MKALRGQQSVGVAFYVEKCWCHPRKPRAIATGTVVFEFTTAKSNHAMGSCIAMTSRRQNSTCWAGRFGPFAAVRHEVPRKSQADFVRGDNQMRERKPLDEAKVFASMVGERIR